MKDLIGPSIAAGVVFVVFLLTLWGVGLLDFEGNDAKVSAAAISLVGALFGSLLTFVGLFLKHAVDQRSLLLKEQEEKRLVVEAAVQAVGLLSSGGKDVPETQRAGIVLALCELNLELLALSLLDQFLNNQQIDRGTAGWVMEAALKSDNTDVQRQASLTLNDHLGYMLAPGGEANFPPTLLDDRYFQLTEDARCNALFCHIDLLLMRDYADWNEGVFFTVLMSLNDKVAKEPNVDNKALAGRALQSFVKVFEPDRQINLPGAPTAKEVVDRLDPYANFELWGLHPLDHLPRIDVLRQWESQNWAAGW